MARIEPEWVAELVRICASDDWAGAERPLSFSSVSPMFRKLLPELAESDDATGYSPIEVRACKAGLEWLAREQRDLYEALTAELNVSRHSRRNEDGNHHERVQKAAFLLGEFIDKACD